MGEIYFDNAATTAICPEAVAAMQPYLEDFYGNPSSMHRKGYEAEKAVKAARKDWAALLGCVEQEVFFTSGGTEGNNTAIIGAAMAAKRRGKHIITTMIEHASVFETCGYLEQQGFEITRLPVDRNGTVDPERLRQALREDTILVAVMAVNNEIGSIMPLETLGSVIKEYNDQIVFFCDAIQAFGKIEMPLKKWQVDLLSVSGHKFHGPKGVGVLYKKQGVRILPLLYGGGQQDGLRSGTENTMGIAGLTAAAQVQCAHLKADYRNKMTVLRETLTAGLADLPEIWINQSATAQVPQIVSLTIQGVRSEVLLHSLEDEGIYISAGSACSSHKRSPSRSLVGIGLSSVEAESTVRISFCMSNTTEEVKRLTEALHRLVPALRLFKRK
ncbi:MAG: cysteine desulfurase family protein [Lachnospiraceae bacterium]|nr:cysteine desulfurase family protein [Lachnospiraceae bacterium]MDY5742741.1 cysteine desulfurase family protein [Lachnospiraceae bacterium]